MRIGLISDVHCEFHADQGKEFVRLLPVDPHLDVLVVAGDFATYQMQILRLSELCQKYEHVVYVCGNHEYYGSDRGHIHENMAKLSRRFSNFHWLHDSVVEIAGKRFIGGTMWFPRGPWTDLRKGFLSDFKTIRGFKKWVYDVNAATTKFLHSNVQPGDIVVTHHLPSMASVPHEHRGSDFNIYYVCPMDSLIWSQRPALWLHGHTHVPCDYELGETRVVANPMGYVGYETTGADYLPKVLDVEYCGSLTAPGR